MGSACSKKSSGDKLNEKKFANECLAAHNRYREKHQVNKLTLCKKLGESAKKWALHLADTDKAECSTSPYGENIAVSTRLISAQAAVDQWYTGTAVYNYDDPGEFSKTGHFTQMVWQESTQLGVGVAQKKSGGLVVVCYYNPAGNIKNHFKANVMPTKAGDVTPTKPVKVGGQIQTATTPIRVRKDDGMKIVKTDDATEILHEIDKEMKKNYEGKEFENSVLLRHNELRKQHGAPDLVLIEAMCQAAQARSETMASQKKIGRSENSEYVENVGYSSKDMSGTDVTNMWYDGEAGKYKYDLKDWQPGCGHFSQIVWRSTRELGVGKATDDKGAVYVCCCYSPAGNLSDEYKDNVFPIGTEVKEAPPVKKENTIEEFQKNVLSKHNEYRTKHHVDELSLDADIIKKAQEWAEHLADIGKLEHQKEKNYGENVAASSRDYNGDQLTDLWYNEVDKYEYDNTDWQSGTGHFTQIVWKESKKMGVGKAKGKGMHYYVSLYEPTGNMLEEFGPNVLRP